MTRLTESQLTSLLRSNPDLRIQQDAQNARQRTNSGAHVYSGIDVPKDASAPSVRLTLAPERPLSRNVTQRMHWSQRRLAYNLIARRTAILARAFASGAQMQLPFAEHVTITFTVYFASHPLDVDNVDVKPYIDALKGVLIADDSPKHVHSLVLVRKDKVNPRVEIEVKPT